MLRAALGRGCSNHRRAVLSEKERVACGVGRPGGADGAYQAVGPSRGVWAAQNWALRVGAACCVQPWAVAARTTVALGLATNSAWPAAWGVLGAPMARSKTLGRAAACGRAKTGRSGWAPHAACSPGPVS